MSYHNYRAKKKKGLITLNKRTITNVIKPADGPSTETQENRFDLEVKRFSESDGTLLPHPEKFDLDLEALAKEKILLQGFIADIDKLLADIKILEEK